MARAVGKPRHRIDIEAALADQHAKRHAARAVVAHHEGRRCLPPERVVDEARDGGPVAGAGEAVRQAPVLQRIGRRTTPRADVGENFDGSRKACAGGHEEIPHHGRPSMIFTMKISHITSSTIAPAP